MSCNNQDHTTTTGTDILAQNIDTTVTASQDFFEYANGGWIKSNPIPADESGWGIGNLVREELYTRLRKINEEAAQGNATTGTVPQKIGDFWKSGMDSITQEKQGQGW